MGVRVHSRCCALNFDKISSINNKITNKRIC